MIIFERNLFHLSKVNILISEDKLLGLNSNEFPREFQIEGFTYHLEKTDSNSTSYITRGGKKAIILRSTI